MIRHLEPDLAFLQRTAEDAGRRCAVGALIFDSASRVFAPRRSPHARNLPSLWDIVGGHVEPGESLDAALRREVHEETGWTVVGEPSLAFVSEWSFPKEPNAPRREFDFIVSVEGDLSSPRLAPDEHTEFRWIRRDDVGLFDENAGADGGLLRRLVTTAFALTPTEPLASPHATLFLDATFAEVEQLRRKWDPVMASHIRAHITVAYPREIATVDEMLVRVEAAVAGIGPFELQLRSVVTFGDPDGGVFVEVDDTSGGWARLRELIVGSAAKDVVRPHVTLVHPRTSALGPPAWDALAGHTFDRTTTVTAAAVTAYDGRQWATVAEHGLRA